MSIDLITKFVQEAPTDPLSRWKGEALLLMAGRLPPDDLLRRNERIVKADTYSLWFRWFVEGMCTPLRYVGDDSKTIVDVLADTRSRIDVFYRDEPASERGALAEAISKHVMTEVTRRRQIERVNASTLQKRDLIDSATTPRCWMCGYAFSQTAIDKFIKSQSSPSLKEPEFVDIFRPRGLYVRDITIEVEHIVPVAGGGGGADNLALACGWCNKSKGARTGLYDAGARAPRTAFTLAGAEWHELPHPFWTVRLVATRRICEAADGCEATADTAELFISPSDSRGSPNPSNLHVYCAEHDPYAASRYFGREAARKIWKAKR